MVRSGGERIVLVPLSLDWQKAAAVVFPLHPASTPFMSPSCFEIKTIKYPKVWSMPGQWSEWMAEPETTLRVRFAKISDKIKQNKESVTCWKWARPFPFEIYDPEEEPFAS